jgi:hypothetical protein
VAQASLLRPGFLLSNRSRPEHPLIRSRHSLPGGLRRSALCEEHFQEGTSTQRSLHCACAPVEMTKGRAVVVRSRVQGSAGVFRRQPMQPVQAGTPTYSFAPFSSWGSPAISALRRTFPRRDIHTEISPLRCAPVEMTKGRAVVVRSRVQGSAGIFRRQPMQPVLQDQPLWLIRSHEEWRAQLQSPGYDPQTKPGTQIARLPATGAG